MKFRISLAGNEKKLNNLTGNFTMPQDTGIIMNLSEINSFKKHELIKNDIIKSDGIILSSEELITVNCGSYTKIIENEKIFNSNEIVITIIGRTLSQISDKEIKNKKENSIHQLNLQTLFEKYNKFKKEQSPIINYDKDNIIKNKLKKEEIEDLFKADKKTVAQVFGISTVMPLSENFVYNINKKVEELLEENNAIFKKDTLYELNKQNIREISQWATSYCNDIYTKDVLIQVDLGNKNIYEMYFPSMYVFYFYHNFNKSNGQGIFSLTLKQSNFKEKEINLK